MHRYGIDADCILPLPFGATRGKQSTKNFLRHYSIRMQSSMDDQFDSNVGVNSMLGRSADDEGEYSSRAEEIEAWLRMYGKQYLSTDSGVISNEQQCATKECNRPEVSYDFHPTNWKYVILDDRPSAAKPDTPLFDRFVLTQTKMGLTDDDAEKVIDLLLNGPKSSQ